jgi:hypothetical protein
MIAIHAITFPIMIWFRSRRSGAWLMSVQHSAVQMLCNHRRLPETFAKWTARESRPSLYSPKPGDHAANSCMNHICIVRLWRIV